MNRTLLLFSMMKKNTRMLQQGKHPTLRKVGMIFLMIYVAAVYGGLAIMQFTALLSAGLIELAISAAFATLVVFVAFLVVMMIPTIFYFSNDLKVYLAMPFTPNQIIGAKTMIVAYGMTPVIALVAACFIISGVISNTLGIAQYILMTLSLFAVGYAAIVAVGVIEIILMRFMPFFRDKDRFMLIVGGVVSIGVVVLMLAINRMDFDDMTQFSSLHIPLEFFPPAWASYHLVVHPSLWNALLVIVSFAICFGLFWLCTKTLYLDIAQNAAIHVAKKKKAKTTGASNASTLTVLIKTEFKNLLRSPTYLMNNVLIGFLVPIIMMVSFYVSFTKASDSAINISELLPLVLDSIQIGEFWFAALIGICCAWVFTSFNMIAATAISRQGRNRLRWMLSAPTPLTMHLKAYVYVGTIFTLINTAVFVVPLFIWLKVSWVMWLGLIVGFVPSVVFENVLNLMVDCYHPSLDWMDENEAIKKNTNSLIGMFFMAVQMVIVIVPIVLNITPKIMVMIALGVMVIGCFFIRPILNHLSKRMMDM